MLCYATRVPLLPCLCACVCVLCVVVSRDPPGHVHSPHMIVSYHRIVYHICHIYHDVMSHHIMSCHIMSCHIMSCHIMYSSGRHLGGLGGRGAALGTEPVPLLLLLPPPSADAAHDRGCAGCHRHQACRPASLCREGPRHHLTRPAGATGSGRAAAGGRND